MEQHIHVREYHNLYETLPSSMRQIIDDCYTACQHRIEEEGYKAAKDDRAEELVAAITHYFNRSNPGLPEPTVNSLGKAGDRAARKGDYARAAVMYGEAAAIAEDEDDRRRYDEAKNTALEQIEPGATDPRCLRCEEPYDPEVIKRRFGDVPLSHGCCSPQCYTSLMMANA